MNFMLNHRLTLAGAALGAVAGFLYWQQIGCVSGTCAITSSPVNSTLYGALLGGLLLNIFKSNKGNTMAIKTIIQSKKGTILDVRTPGEFQGGHVKGSLNIPVQEIPARLDEIKKMQAPIVVCCASGARSGQAERLLTKENIECYNGGSWTDVNRMQSEPV